jgi:hypothetical protein
MERPHRRRVRACVFALLVAMLMPVLAEAQIVPVQVYLSNNPEQWTPAQYSFNPYADVSIFVVMSSQQHPGYAYSGTCVMSLAATFQELYRVRIDGLWLQPGQDVARTPSFRMTWPSAPVTITCSPDWAPAQAISTTLGPEYWYGGTGVTGPGYPTPQPAPQPYYPQPTQPVYEAPTVAPPVDCSSTLLAMGHSASSLMFCEGVNSQCAVALLQMGHPPSSLIFCDTPNPTCAANVLYNGGQPSEIIFCQ